MELIKGVADRSPIPGSDYNERYRFPGLSDPARINYKATHRTITGVECVTHCTLPEGGILVVPLTCSSS